MHVSYDVLEEQSFRAHGRGKKGRQQFLRSRVPDKFTMCNSLGYLCKNKLLETPRNIVLIKKEKETA